MSSDEEPKSLWTSTYADWDHDDLLCDLDLSKRVEIDEKAIHVQLERLAEKLQAFHIPPPRHCPCCVRLP